MSTIRDPQVLSEAKNYLKENFDTAYFIAFEIMRNYPIELKDLFALKVRNYVIVPSQYKSESNMHALMCDMPNLYYALSDDIAQMLDDYIAERVLPSESNLFVSKRGTPLGTTAFSRVLSKVSHALNISDLTCPNLRKTAYEIYSQSQKSLNPFIREKTDVPKSESAKTHSYIPIDYTENSEVGSLTMEFLTISDVEKGRRNALKRLMQYESMQKSALEMQLRLLIETHNITISGADNLIDLLCQRTQSNDPYKLECLQKLIDELNNMQSSINKLKADAQELMDELSGKRFLKFRKEVPLPKQCPFCGTPLTRNNSAIDHIIPPRLGGTSKKENLRYLCKTCNAIKSNRYDPLFEYYFQLLRQTGNQDEQLGIKLDVVLRSMGKEGLRDLEKITEQNDADIYREFVIAQRVPTSTDFLLNKPQHSLLAKKMNALINDINAF